MMNTTLKNMLLFISSIVLLGVCIALIIPVMGLIAIVAVLVGCFAGEMLSRVNCVEVE